MTGQRIAFAGTGGTGKTVTAAAVLKLVPDAVLFPSVSRRYYEVNGVSDERAFWLGLSPDQKIRFQLGMLRFYAQSYEEASRRAGARTLICERSPYCHAAYTIYSSPNLNRSHLDDVREILAGFDDPCVTLFPYPVAWPTDDGFRELSVGKNYALHLITLGLLHELAVRVHRLLKSSSIEERAHDVVDYWELAR